MKKNLTLTCTLIITLVSFPFLSTGQPGYLSQIITNKDLRKNQGFLVIDANYWRYDTCLYSKQLCRYNTSVGINVKSFDDNEVAFCQILLSNNSGYQSKNPYDSFFYSFSLQNVNKCRLVRKLLIKEQYVKSDTFVLHIIDTLELSKPILINKIFDNNPSPNIKSLKVYVLKSVDSYGSLMLHYWVERIGIVKVTDENCWRYSFEMKDDRTTSIEKLYEALLVLIKRKYTDPYWRSDPCPFE